VTTTTLSGDPLVGRTVYSQCTPELDLTAVQFNFPPHLVHPDAPPGIIIPLATKTDVLLASPTNVRLVDGQGVTHQLSEVRIHSHAIDYALGPIVAKDNIIFNVPATILAGHSGARIEAQINGRQHVITTRNHDSVSLFLTVFALLFVGYRLLQGARERFR